MIVRTLRLRHGRLALPRSSTRPWSISDKPRRQYATTIESDSAVPSELETPQRQANPFTEIKATTNISNSKIAERIRNLSVNDPEDPVAQDYIERLRIKDQRQNLGSRMDPYYKPHELLSNPPKPEDITLELLMASGAHLGHATPLWHPGNAQYIFGVRGTANGDPIHIISLDVTASHLRRACKIVQGVAEKGGIILFVGTRAGHSACVVNAAAMTQGYHLFTKWTPGTITNRLQILGGCQKKVVNHLDKEMKEFEEQLPNIAAIKPDLVVCLNPLENYVMLRECGQNGIPTIGIVDTDCNPTWVTYPIPANDDSLRCVQVIAGALGQAGKAGTALRLEAAKRGRYPKIAHMLQPVKQSSEATQGRAADRRSRALRYPPPVTDIDPTSDLEGVAVKDYEQDQALLQAAEQHVEEFEAEEVDTETTLDSAAADAEAERLSELDESVFPDETLAEGEATELSQEDLAQLQEETRRASSSSDGDTTQDTTVPKVQADLSQFDMLGEEASPLEASTSDAKPAEKRGNHKKK